MGFLDTVIKESGNEYAALVSDGVAAGDITTFVDTGSYIFNALVSGSLFGGIPSNKVTALAGESSTGKTFFALSVVRLFLMLTLLVESSILKVSRQFLGI
jgi:ABC-type dipeptide/oligopeptide/nickel transport system ATPase component